MAVVGTISYNGTSISGSGWSAKSDYDDGTYYTYYGYGVLGSNDGGNTWTRIKWFREQGGSFTHTINLESSGYSQIILSRMYDKYDPDDAGLFYISDIGSDPSLTLNSIHAISNTLEMTASPETLSITVNPTNGIGYASSITMDTQVVHSIQGIANGIGGALSTTVELLDILQISANLASGVGGTTGLVQVIQNVSRIISGAVNLGGTPTENATVIAIEPTLMKSYKATTLADGTYEVYLQDIGTYHVLAVFEDGVGNKYGAMIQPFVVITE